MKQQNSTFPIAISTICLMLWSLAAWSNDAVYFARGNQLVPVHETDISISSEVLSITLADDGYARITVDYEFYNHGAARTVEMGFEAAKPYNSGDTLITSGRHPYIEDFTVVMNGQSLGYRTAVIEAGAIDKPFTPEDGMEPDFSPFAYAYYFDAHFDKGKNIVRHTYRYRVSYGIARTFTVPYWLTPALRWRGGKIGDFTLRITADKTAKHFIMADSLFTASEFVVTRGAGKVRHTQYGYEDMVEVALRDATVEWHSHDFVPRANIEIMSADVYTFFDDNYPVGTFYDRSDYYVAGGYNGKPVPRRLARNLPYASRGYVFKDPKLRKQFERFWWYMPDPSWQASTDDFTPREWRLIREGD